MEKREESEVNIKLNAFRKLQRLKCLYARDYSQDKHPINVKNIQGNKHPPELKHKLHTPQFR